MPTKTKRGKGRPTEIDPRRLLDAAQTLFAERGFEGTTTREIARYSKCNIAMISYHFKNKNGLYRAVLLRHFENLRVKFTAAHVTVEELAAVWPELKNNDQRRLCNSLFEAAKVVVLDNRMHKILCREMMGGGKLMIELTASGDFGVTGPIRDLLREFVASGKFDKDLDVHFATISLISPFVYTNIAGPILRNLYDLEINESSIRLLCIYLTRMLFKGASPK